jgi:hypothetical protein
VNLGSPLSGLTIRMPCFIETILCFEKKAQQVPNLGFFGVQCQCFAVSGFGFIESVGLIAQQGTKIEPRKSICRIDFNRLAVSGFGFVESVGLSTQKITQIVPRKSICRIEFNRLAVSGFGFIKSVGCLLSKIPRLFHGSASAGSFSIALR